MDFLSGIELLPSSYSGWKNSGANLLSINMVPVVHGPLIKGPRLVVPFRCLLLSVRPFRPIAERLKLFFSTFTNTIEELLLIAERIQFSSKSEVILPPRLGLAQHRVGQVDLDKMHVVLLGFADPLELGQVFAVFTKPQLVWMKLQIRSSIVLT